MLKFNDMNNEEKVKEILECEKCHLHKTHTICDNCFDKGLLLKMAQWKDEQVRQLHGIIIKLWDMLDWIDTYADLKINGSENDVYFSKIEDKTKERFNLVKSDGYNLFINDEKITNNEHNTTKTD